jgi:hypothetical protein
MKALIVVPFALFSWLLVTFLTKPEPQDHLVKFYRRVSPGGAWGGIPELAKKSAVEAGESLLPPVLRGNFVKHWFGGVLMIYGLVFGIGHLVLLNTSKGLFLLVIAIAGTYLALSKGKGSPEHVKIAE